MRHVWFAGLLVLLALAGCGSQVVENATLSTVSSQPPSMPAKSAAPTRAPEPSAVASPSAVSSPSEAPGGTRSLNAAERRIQEALASIGLVAWVAEMSPPDRASLYVEVGGGRLLTVVTTPAAAAPSDWAVIGVRQLAGVELRRVRDAAGTETELLVCGPELIDVSGTPPEVDETLDALIVRLVPALDCG